MNEISFEQWVGYCENSGLNYENDAVYMFFLYVQARLESGHFTSLNYKEARNLFGMRPSEKRKKFYTFIRQSRGNGLFAGYDMINQSIADRVNWDEYNNVPQPVHATEQALMMYLDAIFAKKYTTPDEWARYKTNMLSIYRKYVLQYSGTTNVPSDFSNGGAVGSGGLSDGGDGDGFFDTSGGFLNWKLIGIPIALLAVGGFLYFKFFKKRN